MKCTGILCLILIDGRTGAIFERGTDEMQAAFRYAVVQFNRINETLRKFELQAFVDVINTADTYKLSRLSESTFAPLSFRLRSVDLT